ncbi:MAG: hypothetical protein RAO92_02340 [Candidatus Euphemobacter frigidus]|nr:hypothetical protein [Candidatus Euphemobacter frigidus]MDP8275222.1 hypothetical protein [Candidatus Euphemobacter frigidus]
MSAEIRRIFCPHCRQESAVKVVKKYDGFTLVGEVKTCAFCGHEFLEEEPEYIEKHPPGWVHDQDLKKVCHRCRHYVVNPFIQKCVLRQKEVEATDTCSDFSLRPSSSKGDDRREESPKPPSILGEPPPTLRLFDR